MHKLLLGLFLLTSSLPSLRAETIYRYGVTYIALNQNGNVQEFYGALDHPVEPNVIYHLDIFSPNPGGTMEYCHGGGAGYCQGFDLFWDGHEHAAVTLNFFYPDINNGFTYSQIEYIVEGNVFNASGDSSAGFDGAINNDFDDPDANFAKGYPFGVLFFSVVAPEPGSFFLLALGVLLSGAAFWHRLR